MLQDKDVSDVPGIRSGFRMDKTRIVTGLSLAALTISVVMALSTVWFALASLVIVLMAAAEWGELMGLNSRPALAVFLMVIVAEAILAWYTWGAGGGWILAVLSGAWWIVAAVILANRGVRQRLGEERPFLLVAALMTLVPGWMTMVMLHRFDPGLLMYLIVLAAMGDTVAYFVGRRFGRRRIAPVLSPGKTWEGFSGEMASAVVVSIIGAFLWENGHLWAMIAFVALSLVAAGASFLGDLFESFLKRIAGAKDSGQMLPGHGGVLDRIDSHLAAAPVFLLGIWGLFGGKVL